MWKPLFRTQEVLELERVARNARAHCRRFRVETYEK